MKKDQILTKVDKRFSIRGMTLQALKLYRFSVAKTGI